MKYNFDFSRKYTYLFLICWIIFSQNLYGLNENIESESVYNYNGIPGCECFLHCSCYSDIKGGKETAVHPKTPEDILWHFFIKSIIAAKSSGPYIESSIRQICYEMGYFSKNDLSMLSEYLMAIEKFKDIINREGEKSIKLMRSIYSSPKDTARLKEKIEIIQKKIRAAKKILEKASSEIIPLYYKVLFSCPHKGCYNLALIYNEGFYYFINGDFDTSLEKIDEFVLFAELSNSKEKLLNSRIYNVRGSTLLEIGLYHEAISAFTKSIEKDPANKEVYNSRAAAYFEIGDFDSAINDYKSSENGASPIKVEPRTSNEFSAALLNSIKEGGKDAACEFIPSLCNTVYGVGECLWCFVQAPIASSVEFCEACLETGEAVSEYIKNLDMDAIEELALEVKELYGQFDNLNDAQKGQAIGYSIGKYGVDIFSGCAAIKCINAMQKLKKINRIMNLEALASSESSKELIKTAALAHSGNRDLFFRNVKIQWDKQNKHIYGSHNYVKGKSILEHKDPESLLKQFAGTGRPVRGIVGDIGYQEVVNFNETIGICIDEKGIETITTWGKIHYAKDGAHIVPTRPKK